MFSFTSVYTFVFVDKKKNTIFTKLVKIRTIKSFLINYGRVSPSQSHTNPQKTRALFLDDCLRTVMCVIKIYYENRIARFLCQMYAPLYALLHITFVLMELRMKSIEVIIFDILNAIIGVQASRIISKG